MRRSSVARIACAISIAGSPIGALSAQELSEREFLSEFPTVLSASRLSQDATETPLPVTVIDQQTIRASGAREIAELFRLVPGFNVSYVASLKGLQPIVNYHGLDQEFFSRLQVLIDGRSVNNATLGGVDWSEFPLSFDDIDRIEVIRGPSNASHGIGAFMATINFITKHASQQPGAAGMVRAGNDRILDGASSFGASAGPIEYSVAAGYRSDNGFADLDDRRRREYIRGRADWQLGSYDSLMLQAAATDGVNDIAGSGPTNPQRSAQVSTAYAQAKWERGFDADNGLSLQFYWYQFRLDDEFLTDPLPGPGNQRFRLDGGTTVRRVDVEFQQNMSVGPSFRWVWGASAREDSSEVPLLFPNSSLLRIQRIFAHGEYRPDERFLFNAGAMVEHNNLSGTDVAPQIALNYRLSPTQTIRFSLARALRTPTPIESQGKFGTGPPGSPLFGPSDPLQPETIFSREISYVGEWPSQHATLDIKLFDDSIRNLIDLKDQPGDFPAAAYPRQAINGDSARQTGIEGQLSWRPSDHSRIVASFTHLQTHSADNLDNYSTSAPRDVFHMLLSQRFSDAWDASLTLHQQSAFKATGSSDPQKGFTRVDMRIARMLPTVTGRGEVALSVENALNSHYTEYRKDLVAERRAWLTMDVHF